MRKAALRTQAFKGAVVCVSTGKSTQKLFVCKSHTGVQHFSFGFTLLFPSFQETYLNPCTLLAHAKSGKRFFYNYLKKFGTLLQAERKMGLTPVFSLLKMKYITYKAILIQMA